MENDLNIVKLILTELRENLVLIGFLLLLLFIYAILTALLVNQLVG